MLFPFRGSRRLSLSALALAVVVSPMRAHAQQPEPIGLFVVDARGAVPVLPHEATIAEPRGLTDAQLPAWGWGIDVGAHVYPLRWKVITFGVGASVLWSGRTRSQPTLEGETEPSGPKVTTRLEALSPQVSFNFGRREGYSYISGGIGRSTLAVSPEEAPEDGTPIKTINYGGGARWFIRDHLAFTFDIRFYAMNPQLPDENTAGHPRLTVTVFSAGISIR